MDAVITRTHTTMSLPIEITEQEYRPFQFGILDILAIMTIVAVLLSVARTPHSIFHCIAMLFALYMVKTRIMYLRVAPSLAISLYVIAVAALFPYLCFCIPDKWPDTATSPLVDWLCRNKEWWFDYTATYSRLFSWIDRPIAIFTVPTASFLLDLIAGQPPRLRRVILRSIIEIAVIIPLWVLFCLVFELFISACMWISSSINYPLIHSY
jgi:hypothetical protein